VLGQSIPPLINDHAIPPRTVRVICPDACQSLRLFCGHVHDDRTVDPLGVDIFMCKPGLERPGYWSTSSASIKRCGGTVSPRALAVLRLMTKSIFVGRSTGRSAGLAPCKILSTRTAARQARCTRFAPYDMRPPALTYTGR